MAIADHRVHAVGPNPASRDGNKTPTASSAQSAPGGADRFWRRAFATDRSERSRTPTDGMIFACRTSWGPPLREAVGCRLVALY